MKKLTFAPFLFNFQYKLNKTIMQLLSVLILLSASFALNAQVIDLGPEALYLYKPSVFGVWGNSRASLPPAYVQMNFQQRVTDYPCCPDQGFLQPSSRDPGLSSNRPELRGFTQKPSSGLINLVVPGINLSNMQIPDSKNIVTELSGVPIAIVATHKPLKTTPDSRKNLRHALQFEFMDNLIIQMREAEYTDNGAGRSTRPSRYIDTGSSDRMLKEGYFLVKGELKLPGGLPISMDQEANSGRGALYTAKPGWHSHYDIVVKTQNSSRSKVSGIRLYNFFKGRNNTQTRVFFHTFLKYNSDDAKRLSELAGATEFGLYRKAWGALRSGPRDICVASGCLVSGPPMGMIGRNSGSLPGRSNRFGQVQSPFPGRSKRPTLPGKGKRLSPQAPSVSTDSLVANRLFTPVLSPELGFIHVPARLSFRLVAAPGSDLNGVSLKISARRKSDGKTIQGVEKEELFSKVYSTYHQPQIDPPVHSSGIVPGIPTVREKRIYLQLDDTPGTEYTISCTIKRGNMAYDCSRGRPSGYIRSLSQMMPDSPNSYTPGERRIFRTFEEAFGSYVVGMPYTNARDYIPMQDAYPLYEIMFRKP